MASSMLACSEYPGGDDSSSQPSAAWEAWQLTDLTGTWDVKQAVTVALS